MAGCVDDIALIRSMHTSHSNHYNATLGMHTGSFAQSRPSMGSWVTYGLGTLNRNLPGFVVMLDPSGGPISASVKATSQSADRVIIGTWPCGPRAASESCRASRARTMARMPGTVRAPAAQAS